MVIDVTGDAPDTIRIHTPDNVALGYTTAGLGSRMAAQLIDNLAAFAIVIVALVAYAALAGAATTQQGEGWVIGGAAASSFFVYFGYFLVSELASGGRTAGKVAMGLRVMRVDGSAPDFAAIVSRNVVRVLDVLFGLGVLLMFFHPLSRRLGDLAGGTVVVRERAQVTLAAATVQPPVILRAPDAGPHVDGIEHLGTREMETLRVFLARQGLAPDLRSRLAADMARRLCERLQLAPTAPERMWPPELLLERVYMQLQQQVR